ncbi:MAG TPA: uridine kinase [Mycobacteriales bacterium]|nr:uridine kinase [Mycobacteriales bacterium]
MSVIVDDLVPRLGGLIEALARVDDRVSVAIDGPDAAGKTTLADALAHHLTSHVVRASVDAFLLPAGIRYRRGPLSPQGCYLDSYDYAWLRREVLDPFAGGGAPAVLVVDGLFLLRPELRERWTLSVHLDVAPAETLRRARVRDADLLGDELERRYAERYLPAQDLYRADADPLGTADVVIGYDDPAHPIVRRWPEL